MNPFSGLSFERLRFEHDKRREHVREIKNEMQEEEEEHDALISDISDGGLTHGALDMAYDRHRKRMDSFESWENCKRS